ncbi:UDP-N-acetylglucosamine 1-carboxyvinyltransferase [Candidatus Saccharibacteria bacterium]|nr:UDP-N-acetylglucosamine 1-carboxyvinyltransferase [Candidatus Saccharibacteria bacterium]
MQNTNEKIGNLIYQIRQERGLTQAEFAKQLNTSQSAVNRIEHGKQNLSLDMLGRISDVLNKPLISISEGAINLRIEGGHELKGSVSLKTSKNAAVALLCASLLNSGTTRLKKVPRIEEVNRLIEVLRSIGVSVKWQGENNLEIKPPQKLQIAKMNKAAAKRTRSVIMFMGPLMHQFRSFSIPFAGGCELGKRTVLPHLYGLEEFGVQVATKSNHYEISSTPTRPKRPVVLYESGDTTTENIIMAAARTEGETIIKMASANYMVQDLCFFLKRLGVKIDGIGTSCLRIRGIKHIKKNVSYSPAEDPVEAMTFIAAAVTTNSHITIKRVPIEFLQLELLKLEKMGLKYDETPRYKADNGQTDLVDLTIHKYSMLVAPKEKIHPSVYPGLNIDHLPYFVPIAAVAHGRTLIHDWIYEDRALMYTELKKIGVKIELADPHRVYVDGPTRFKSADVVSPSGIRPAVILLIGMMAAQGTSMLRNVYTINRGYEDLAERLNSLGARISIMHEL